MSDMHKLSELDHDLAEMIRKRSATVEGCNSQVKAAIAKANAATEAARNFKPDTTQIDAAVRAINGQN